MIPRRVFLTGGTGFIGARARERLLRDGVDVRALTRTPRADEAAGDASLTWIEGALDDPGAWTDAVRDCDAIVHLAASTGKVSAAQHARVNVDGTRALLDAARGAGVGRFLHVSTIAVRYPELRRYPYARSKLAAEELVRASGLDWTVLRPTVVLGRGSPIGASLAGLARLPATPMFGPGRALVQPVHVDDVAAACSEALESGLVGAAVDLGGPEVVSFADLLRRLRVAAGRPPGPLVRLPLVSTMAVLGALEPALGGVLPVTAGQLYAFRYDGVAARHPWTDGRRERAVDLETQLREAVLRG